MINKTSSEIKSVTLAPGQWTQLPDQNANSLTILNPTNKEVTVKQLKIPSLERYSFKDYAPAGSFPCAKEARIGSNLPLANLTNCEEYGLGEISTVETKIGDEKIISPEDPSKRLAAFTKLNDLIDKNNLEISFDFSYDSSDLNVPKITQMSIDGTPYGTIPAPWNWGSTYTVWNYTSSYPGGIGTSLFENPTWGIVFTVSNYPKYLWDMYNHKNFRLVVYNPTQSSATSGIDLEYWTSSRITAVYNEAAKSFTFKVPLYELANMPIGLMTYVSVERDKADDFSGAGWQTSPKIVGAERFSKVTPFQKVVLRSPDQNGTLGTNVSPKFFNSARPDPGTVRIDSVTRLNNVLPNNLTDYLIHYSLGLGIVPNACSIEYATNISDFNGSNYASQTNTCSGPRYIRASNAPTMFFRLAVTTNNNAIIRSPILACSAFLGNGSVNGVSRLNAPESSEELFAGITPPAQSALATRQSRIFAPWNYATIGNREYLRKIHSFKPNTIINFFAFGKWTTKPFPEGLPFSIDPNVDQDAYRFSFNLYDGRLYIYHGSNSFLPSSAVSQSISRFQNRAQLNTYPFFNYGVSSTSRVCGEERFYSVNNLPVFNAPISTVDNSSPYFNNAKIQFQSGVIKVYVNGILVGMVNDALYRKRSEGDYIGVTTSHVFSESDQGTRLETMWNNFGSSLPGDVKIKNFKLNNIELSKFNEPFLSGLPSLTVFPESGLELDGISNTNQFFLKNNSNQNSTISYRLTN